MLFRQSLSCLNVELPTGLCYWHFFADSPFFSPLGAVFVSSSFEPWLNLRGGEAGAATTHNFIRLYRPTV